MNVLEITANLNKIVYYRDFYNIPEWTEFYLKGCTVRKDVRGVLHYTAELLDKSGRCIINAGLDKIKSVEEKSK